MILPPSGGYFTKPSISSQTTTTPRGNRHGEPPIRFNHSCSALRPCYLMQSPDPVAVSGSASRYCLLAAWDLRLNPAGFTGSVAQPDVVAEVAQPALRLKSPTEKCQSKPCYLRHPHPKRRLAAPRNQFHSRLGAGHFQAKPLGGAFVVNRCSSRTLKTLPRLWRSLSPSSLSTHSSTYPVSRLMIAPSFRRRTGCAHHGR
jgi:hypothetical protein